MSDIIETAWEEIIKEFGFKAPTAEEKKGFADTIIPLEKDVIILENKSSNKSFEIAEGFSIYNIQDKEQEENYIRLLQDWDTYYEEVIKEGRARLDFTAQNIEKEGKRVHKLLILDGIDKSLSQYYGTNFAGLIYNSGLKEDKFGKVTIDFGYGVVDKKTQDSISLFAYGLSESNLHILTEQQLTFLNVYLPTLQSIVDYLNWKEQKFTTITIMSVDEYTLLLLYLLEVFKGKKQTTIMVPFEDKVISEFIESDLSKNLLNSTSMFQEFLRYSNGNSDFKQHYLLYTLKTELLLAEQLPDLIFTDYSVHSSKTFMLYQGKNLYIFHNADDKISDAKYRTVYSGHFISKVALQYIKELKSDIEVDKIICCVMHRTNDDSLSTTFIALNIMDILSSDKHLKDIEDYAAEGETVGWLPKTIELSQLKEQRQNEIKESIPEQKGSDRNRPCPCGSGKKYKKCCGKLR